MLDNKISLFCIISNNYDSSELIENTSLKFTLIKGAWVAQLGRFLALAFSLVHDLRVMGSNPVSASMISAASV